MIKKQVLTAALLTAVLLLTGCILDAGQDPSATAPRSMPDTTEKAAAETQTWDDLPVLDPIPSEYGEKEPEPETAPETRETTETMPEGSGEDIAPTTEGDSTDITGESAAESASGTESPADIEGGSTGEEIPESVTTRPGDNLPETEEITLDPSWKYAEESEIHSGAAVLYRARENRRNIVVGVNAGHGTKGGESSYTYCHPDHTPKVTGGTTSEGSIKAMAVSSGMDFRDGTPERKVTLKTAKILKDLLLEAGYDVLMLRDGDDVQLDNVARTVICNNRADCHIAIHWDGDGYSYDKGAYFMSVPGELKSMYPVSEHWREHEALGWSLIEGCQKTGYKVWSSGDMDMDLTQTSYSTVPSVDIEMGNQNSDTDDDACRRAAKALFAGIEIYFSGE